jgi:hypothetical protein
MQGTGRAVSVKQRKGAPDNQSKPPSKKKSGASETRSEPFNATAGCAMAMGRSNGQPEAAIFSDSNVSWLKPAKPSSAPKRKRKLSGHAQVVADVNDSDMSLGDSDIMDDEFEGMPDGPDASASARQGPESDDEVIEEEDDEDNDVDQEKEEDDSDDDEVVCSISGKEG